MSRIDPVGAGLTLGLLLGGVHAAWSTLVAIGAAPWVMSVVFRLHFIRPPFEIDGFDLCVAAFLVVMAALAGCALGWLFAALWNGLASPRATAPFRQDPPIRALLCAAGLVLAACATPPARPAWSSVPPLPALDPAQQRGHDFAVRRCAGCHTVGLDDGGAADGPAFYKLARRYNPISLERRFAEVSEHGFDRMPAIPFTRAEAEDLLAYFDSLQGN